MEIKTKFSIDDEVYVIAHNKINKTVITRVRTYFSRLNVKEKKEKIEGKIIYDTSVSNDMEEKFVYSKVEDIPIN